MISTIHIRMALIVGFLVAATNNVQACYCGATRYAVCQRTCCAAPEQVCHTVMKTCQEVVYEQKQYTCYRTCYQPNWEEKTVWAVRYVTETKFRDYVETVNKPVYETMEREVDCTVLKPVKTMQTVKVCGGHWETREKPVCTAKTTDPCEPPAKTTEQCRVWVPEVVAKQVECIQYVPAVVKQKVPYTVCKMVQTQQVRQASYTVCKAVPYDTVVRCVRYVAVQVPYTVTRCEPRVVCKQVPVQVCCPTATCCH